MAFQRLVRFDLCGESYGDLLEVTSSGYRVQRLDGNLKEGFRRLSEEMTVKELLCPIANVPIIQCIGLNYRKHANEASLEVPEYPVVFSKPTDAVAGPNTEITVCPEAQSMLDYEGELTVIIAKDCKNLPEDFLLSDVVLGYTAGNDVSARNFQLPKVSGGQFCYAKSFDRFAPIGPFIASHDLVPNPQALRYVTRVNGEIVQNTGTDDMIWTVRQIIRHLSRGTTLRAGTAIMTGTPAGVGFFRQKFLKNGDTVEVEIEGLMTLSNRFKFE